MNGAVRGKWGQQSISRGCYGSSASTIHRRIHFLPSSLLCVVRIAVVGCGAVGSFYGARLARAGEEVHFLLRSDYEAVRRQGVVVRSSEGDFQVRPYCAHRPEEIGSADLVLIGLKTTANEAFPRLLPPLVGSRTVLLTLQNGLGNEEDLARLFPTEQIMGGLCFVCLNRVAPGVIQHIGYGQVVVGEFKGRPEARTHELAGRFGAAGVACSVSENLARAHWEKLVWNIPFNGLGVAGVAGYEALIAPHSALARRQSDELKSTRPLSTDRLLADARWAELVRELMLEVITAARALGFDLPETLVDLNIDRTRRMGAYRASTLIDFERGQPLELQSLFLEPLRRATAAGIAMPRLSALCAVLTDLDQRQGETRSRGPAFRARN
jgi:2-dehydropantoate 2-reductase